MRQLYSVLIVVILIFGVILSVGTIKASAQASDIDTTIISVRVISECFVELIVYPEKRIPATGNWANTNKVEFVSQAGQSLGVITLQADNEGKMRFDSCVQYPISSGIYTVFVSGISHLRARFDAVTVNVSATTQIPSINLTTSGQKLLAGETSTIFDNKINSLDLSTQISAMYSTTNVKNDLNRDGKVNALDISNTIFNFYKTGQ